MCTHAYRHVRIRILQACGAEMSVEVCVDVYADMCADVCADVCVGMCADTRVGICVDVCAGHVCRPVCSVE